MPGRITNGNYFGAAGEIHGAEHFLLRCLRRATRYSVLQQLIVVIVAVLAMRDELRSTVRTVNFAAEVEVPRSVGRRTEILDAFIRHVAERGYDRTNMGDIADELGMSKGTIVHHFGTKAQMLRELEETHLASQLRTTRMVFDRLDLPHERIAAIIYASVLMQVLAPDAAVASQREIAQLSDDPAMEEVRNLRRQLEELVAGEIRAGVKAGVFRSVNVELATLQLWGSVQWMWVWFDSGGSWVPEQVGSAFVDMFLGGLLLDRLGLSKLADPRGHVVKAVRECLDVAAETTD